MGSVENIHKRPAVAIFRAADQSKSGCINKYDFMVIYAAFIRRNTQERIVQHEG